MVERLEDLSRMIVTTEEKAAQEKREEKPREEKKHRPKKLKNLSRAITVAEERTSEEKRKERLRKEKECRANRKFWEREKRKRVDKLKLAEDIFRWGSEFSQTEEYKRLLKLGFSGLTGMTNVLWFYTSGWGHKRNEDGGCWARLHLQKDGTFHYIAGYKWMPTGPELYFCTPKELAKLSEWYLKKLHQFVMTVEVYERLRKVVKAGD